MAHDIRRSGQWAMGDEASGAEFRVWAPEKPG